MRETLWKNHVRMMKKVEKKCKRLDAKYKKKRAVITDITQSCREM